MGEEGREAVPRSRQLSHYAATNPATKLLPTSCLSNTSLPTFPCRPPRSTCLSAPSSTSFLSTVALWVDSHIMRQRILQRSCFQPPACPTLLHQPCLVCHRGQHACLLLLQLLSSAVGLCGLTLILCGNESCNEAILTSMPETSTLIKASR